MRVLPWKCPCPSFICFSKCYPGLHSQSALKFEDAQQVTPTPSRLDHDAETEFENAGGGGLDLDKDEEKRIGGGEDFKGRSVHLEGEKVEGGSLGDSEERRLDGVKFDMGLKSSLKKQSESGSKETSKERVKWMDFAGKELVDVREIENVELEYLSSEDKGNKICVCVIQ